MQRDSLKNTLRVSLILCVVCSVIVSTAAVALRSSIVANQEQERKKNILIAAGLFDPNTDSLDKIEVEFKKITPVLISLKTGAPVSQQKLESLGGEKFDQKKAINNPDQSAAIKSNLDVAGIKRREKYAWVYQVIKEGGSTPSQYVLPVRGKGLWSTLWGFVAIDKDCNTINGLTFYAHAETPGLGAEISDSEKFKASWRGKKSFNEAWEIKISLPKQISPNEQEAIHQVQAIPGATITSRGVQNMLHFWLGDQGFGKYLESQRPNQPEKKTDAKKITTAEGNDG